MKTWRPVAEIGVCGAVAMAVHAFLLMLWLGKDFSKFHIPLAELYAFFGLSSMAIIAILVLVRKKNTDSVGQIFMALTCAKAVAAWFVGKPLLLPDVPQWEKMQFFILFLVFLALETAISVRLLRRGPAL
jgi:hypothetical protein